MLVFLKDTKKFAKGELSNSQFQGRYCEYSVRTLRYEHINVRCTLENCIIPSTIYIPNKMWYVINGFWADSGPKQWGNSDRKMRLFGKFTAAVKYERSYYIPNVWDPKMPTWKIPAEHAKLMPQMGLPVGYRS